MSNRPWKESVYWSILMSRPLGSDTRTPFYVLARASMYKARLRLTADRSVAMLSFFI